MTWVVTLTVLQWYGGILILWLLSLLLLLFLLLLLIGLTLFYWHLVVSHYKCCKKILKSKMAASSSGTESRLAVSFQQKLRNSILSAYVVALTSADNFRYYFTVVYSKKLVRTLQTLQTARTHTEWPDAASVMSVSRLFYIEMSQFLLITGHGNHILTPNTPSSHHPEKESTDFYSQVYVRKLEPFVKQFQPLAGVSRSAQNSGWNHYVVWLSLANFLTCVFLPGGNSSFVSIPATVEGCFSQTKAIQQSIRFPI